MTPTSQRLLDPHFVSKLARLDLRARLVVDGFLTGLHRSPYHGFSVEFAEHRKYLKQYEEETNLRATLLIDTSASMSYSSHGLSKLDYARQLAASLAYLMLRQNDAVGMFAFASGRGELIPPRSTPSHMRQLLVLLERLEAKGGTDFASSLHALAERVKQRGLIIILSDLLDDPERIASAIHHFRHRKHEVLVFHVLDPQELTFAFEREATYIDLESGDRVTTRPQELRGDYRTRV